MRTINTCLNCEDRTVGCHGKCERYQAERKAFLDEKQKVYEGRRRDIEIDNYEKKKKKRIAIARDGK